MEFSLLNKRKVKYEKSYLHLISYSSTIENTLLFFVQSQINSSLFECHTNVYETLLLLRDTAISFKSVSLRCFCQHPLVAKIRNVLVYYSRGTALLIGLFNDLEKL